MPAGNGVGGTTGDSTDASTGAGKSEGLSALAAERLPELARRAEQAFNENVDRLRTQSREAADKANEQLEHARTYVVERVQERPFTTTLAVLGAGFLIGLLFAGRRR